MRRALAFALLVSVICWRPTSKAAEQAKPSPDMNRQRPSVFDLPKIQVRFGRLQKELQTLFKKGDHVAAEKLCRETISLLPHGSAGHYNLACALARQGKTKDALDSLAQAVALGFREAKKIQEDPDLESLRRDGRFAEIVEQASKAEKKQEGLWQFKVTPGRVENGVALVSGENTAWDGRLGVFKVLFAFEAKPAEGAEAVLEHGQAGELLRRWFKEGVAAGNHGDLYDNHDNDHSNMAYQQFPQLTRVEFSEEAKARRLHNGPQLSLFYSSITIGNSSTAMVGGPFWRSQPRLALVDQRSAALLYVQYVGNHLYFYPEHRDHDPGHNGKGGYGDLYPANTPYLIISQGSSGSDRPFLDAIACTLAAFRPKVKQYLAATRTLMPAVQMIFRSCNKNLASPGEYLTGKAHPSVFQAGDIDVLAMVKMAHEMKPESTPPMVQLKVVEEDQAVAGRDYFGVAGERLFDTPAAIARVFRSTKYVKRMVVSAEASRDLQKRPLTWHWSVLRGDAEAIQIKPLNEAGSRVELLIPYQPRWPISPGSNLWSNRTDIGAFVHNGQYYSAPGFITFLSLDSEKRAYDEKNQIQDVWYGMDGNYVDPLIEPQKKWWDRYEYDHDKLIGWTRFRGGKKQEFTADGAVVVERDEKGRALKARTVKYIAKSDGKTHPVLEQGLGDELLHYKYESDEDRVGSVVSREAAK